MENNPKFYPTLKLISEKLENINYALIGSVNLYLQGIKLEPRDVDILTTSADIILIDEILKEYRTKEICFDDSDGRNSFRSFYKINAMEIEVLGNVNNTFRDAKSLDKKIEIKFKDISLPCIFLLDELETYKKMGRLDKVKLIKNFLQNN